MVYQIIEKEDGSIKIILRNNAHTVRIKPIAGNSIIISPHKP